MAGFKASKAVAPLDFDFNPFVSCSGTIPEPTPDQLRTFLDTLNNMLPTDDEADADEDIAKSAKSLAKRFDSVEMKRMDDESLSAVVDLCGDVFTIEQLRELPVRPQRAFVRWLIGEMQDPNSLKPATNR